MRKLLLSKGISFGHNILNINIQELLKLKISNNNTVIIVIIKKA